MTSDSIEIIYISTNEEQKKFDVTCFLKRKIDLGLMQKYLFPKKSLQIYFWRIDATIFSFFFFVFFLFQSNYSKKQMTQIDGF